MKCILTSFLFILTTTFLVAQNKVEPIVQFGHGSRSVSEMVFSPDGSMLATTDGEFLKLWDFASGLEFRAFANETFSFGGISRISFTPDNNGIVYKSGYKILFHDISDGKITDSRSLGDSLEINVEENKIPETEEVEKYLNQEQSNGIVFSKDGSLIAEASSQKILIKNQIDNAIISTIKLPEKESKNEDGLSLFLALKQSIKSFSFSTDKNKILYQKQLYNVADGKLDFHFLKDSEDFIQTSGVFSPDGKTVALGGFILQETEEDSISEDGLDFLRQLAGDKEGDVLYLFDTQSGNLINKIFSKGVFSLQFSSDSKQLLVGHGKNHIELLDWKNNKQILSFKTREDKKSSYSNLYSDLLNFSPVGAVVFTPDGKGILASGEFNGIESLIIWDAKTGKPVRNLGASIPPINLEGQASSSDSIFLREYLELQKSIFTTNPQKIYQGFRMLNLTNAKVPEVFMKNDSIIFSPHGNRYMSIENDELIEVYDSDFSEHLCALENSNGFTNLSFDTKGDKVIGSKRNVFKVWNAKNGAEEWVNEEHKKRIDRLEFSYDGKQISSISRSERVAIFWSVEKQEERHMVKEFFLFKFLDLMQGILQATRGFRNPLKNNNSLLGEKDSKMDRTDQAIGLINSKGYYEVSFSADGKRAAIWLENLYGVTFVDLESGKKLMTYVDPKLMALQKFAFSSMEKSQKESNSTEETDTLKSDLYPENMGDLMMEDFKNRFNLQNLSTISPDFKLLAKATKRLVKKEGKEDFIEIKEIKKTNFFPQKLKRKKKRNKSWKLNESTDYQDGLTFSLDGKKIAASSRSKNAIRIWNVADGTIYKTLQGHSGKIIFGPKGKTLISSGWDRQVKVWSIEENKLLYTFIGIKGSNDYIVILPNGYYTTSRKESKAVAFRQGKKAYPFEQFDLQFNRPDILLELIGEEILTVMGMDINPNKKIVQAYYSAYQKRLQKKGFEENMFRKDFKLPEVELRQLSPLSNQKKINLFVNAKDESYQLSSLNVWINDVPIFGQSGKTLSSEYLSSKGFSEYTETIPVTLSNGENKIQVSVLNSNGVESLKQTQIINYTGIEAPSDLHIVTLGASNFKDQTMNLDYPVKDLKAFEDMMKNENSLSYQNIFVHTLRNEEFTISGLKKMEQQLAKAKVDDKVIFFIATHGLLDEKSNYFLATHDVDFINPSSNGFAFEQLESMLDKIPARNKVVFVDACHAGEIDTTNISLSLYVPEEGEVKFRRFRSSNWNQLGKQNSFELMKDLFVDLRRGTGATIISSAGGAEFAMEGPEWKNSVFTFSLLQGLKEKKADLNFDGEITISELQKYLHKKVRRLTQNLQRPTYRVENISNDWRIW